MPLTPDQQAVRRLRAEVSELEVLLHRKRDELYDMQKQVFKNCTHEWIQEEESGTGYDGFWYGYCPWTCKLCGHFKSGPIKV